MDINTIKSFEQFLLEEFNVGKAPIANLTKYLDDMNKGFCDKLFFVNILKYIDVIIDFGSADGQMLKFLSDIKPELKLIGYDIDENMIKESKKKYPNFVFTDRWEDVIRILDTNEYRNLSKALLLSSVIHEIYSYSGGKNIKKFWKEQAFNDRFLYVIIRDMIPSIETEKRNAIDIHINKIREKSNPIHLKEFEDYWGPIDTNFRTLLHWLLKYKYTDNWNRELKENYLPISLEYLKKKIPESWTIIYEDHYAYEYIKKQVKQDFDVDIDGYTHLKMIIKNNKFPYNKYPFKVS